MTSLLVKAIMSNFQVQINFLPVGHTHEDIDQVFSKVSDNIRKNGCESIPGTITVHIPPYTLCAVTDLLGRINQSCKPNPISKLIEGVWDFKAWLKPMQGEMENHSKYHVFRFTKTSSSKVYA